MIIDLNLFYLYTLKFYSSTVRRRHRTRDSLASGPLRKNSAHDRDMEPEPESEPVTTFKNLSVNTSSNQTMDCATLVMTTESNLNINPSTSRRSDQKNNNDTEKLKQANEKRSTEKRPTEKRPPHEVRYDQRGHLAKFDNQENGTRCKKENCKSRTHMYCVKCNVHLCVAKDKNCFHDFHVLLLPEN